MKNRIKQLKVKIKSLAAESRIIRLESNRSKDPTTKCDLNNHRVGIVRTEARYSQLAYGFLRGLKYSQLESKTNNPVNFTKVENLVKRFGVCIDYTLPDPYDDFRARARQQEALFLKWVSEAKNESCKNTT